MKILFVHQNFPGQYKHLAPAMAALGHDVRALGMTEKVQMPGVQYQRYGSKRGSTQGVHPWVIDFEAKVIRGEACARVASQWRDQGYTPDVICAHPGAKRCCCARPGRRPGSCTSSSSTTVPRAGMSASTRSFPPTPSRPVAGWPSRTPTTC